MTATLRETARRMRERAEGATSGPWEFRARRGFQMMHDNPATIGFTGGAGYFVMLREGTWGTEGDMTYVASWHPAVALAVADWLHLVAGLLEQGFDENAETRAALAVARAYLGEDS